jgi:type II secretory pathway predicted ATPase ExeA
MYERFFNFKSKPFALSPDPKFLYASAQHAAALTLLEYGIESQASFCLLTGEIGSGKTTVLRQLIRTLGSAFTIGLVSNTHQGFTSIVPWALSALGVNPADSSPVAQYEALTTAIIRAYGQGKRTLLIFDEAQNLSVALLEELRLLSNLNSEQDVALQVMLVGQPELRTQLERPELTQFAQRVSVDFHLDRLAFGEARAYVRHRLTVAGGDPELFAPDAVAFIHARANGVPRLINQLCDLSLVYAFAEQRTSIDVQLIRQVLQERGHGRSIRLFANDPAAMTMTPRAALHESTSAPKRV